MGFFLEEVNPENEDEQRRCLGITLKILSLTHERDQNLHNRVQRVFGETLENEAVINLMHLR